MIQRTHRFHGRTSLRFVYSRGQTVRTAPLALKYALNTRRRKYRVAVVVSRKVHKSAVVRNRIRRRLYEAIRLLAADVREPYDLVFTVFSEQLATLDSRSIHDLVRELLEKARVRPGSPRSFS